MTASVQTGARLALGLLPVLCFLVALISLDSYKLVRLRTVLTLLAIGALAAGASFFINSSLAARFALEPASLARYVAPVVEEVLKGGVIVYLVARRRVGFLVDAAIAGFAVGAGFAAVENIHYSMVLGESRVSVWIVRGFGTAIMHGGVTASLGIVAKLFSDRAGRVGAATVAPGWLLAVAVHSAFNHFFLAPDLSTLALLTGLPLLFLGVFRLSERSTRDWLGTGFDTDAELLQLISQGRVSESRVGSYLESLKTKFPPTTVADMLCLLRLRLELSIRAKGILLLQEGGYTPEPDPEVPERFTELRFLERSIGKTGLAALAPILHFSDRDLWQYHMLGGNDGGRRRA